MMRAPENSLLHRDQVVESVGAQSECGPLLFSGRSCQMLAGIWTRCWSGATQTCSVGHISGQYAHHDGLRRSCRWSQMWRSWAGVVTCDLWLWGHWMYCQIPINDYLRQWNKHSVHGQQSLPTFLRSARQLHAPMCAIQALCVQPVTHLCNKHAL